MFEQACEDTGDLLPFDAKRILRRKLATCPACVNMVAMRQADAIAAQLATITLRTPKAENTVVPVGFKVGQGKLMAARGAYKPKLANRGDAPTSTHAAQSAKVVFANAAHRSVRALAYKGW